MGHRIPYLGMRRQLGGLGGSSLASAIALMRSLIDTYGGVFPDFQDKSGAVAVVYNKALALGRDVVINGDFAAGDDGTWTKGTGWTIPGVTVAHCDGSQIAASTIYQDANLLVNDQTWEITFTLSNYAAGNASFICGGNNNGSLRAADGTYVEEITLAGILNTRTGIKGNVDFIGDINNVIIKQTDILASSAYPGAELYVTANAASDPNGNEADATTGWAADSSTMTSDSAVKNVGGYSLKHIATGGTGKIYFDLDTILTIGKRYRLVFDTRHLGSGGNNSCYLAATPGATNTLLVALTSADTAFQTVTREFVHDSNSRYFNARESSPTNDGGVYIDNVSLTEVNPLNADHTGVTVAQPGPADLLAVLFDGATSYTDWYSAELNSMFDPTQGTLVVACKVANVGVWTDGTSRYLLHIKSDTNNFIYLVKSSANNALSAVYKGGGVSEIIGATSISTTDWFLVALTWDTAANAFKMYVNDTLINTLTIAGTWAGNLSNTATVIGAATTTPLSVFDGLLTVPVLYLDALTADEILQIAKSLGVA